MKLYLYVYLVFKRQMALTELNWIILFKFKQLKIKIVSEKTFEY